jgi:hypothetical protein
MINSEERNTLRVKKGSDINWSVSLDGYSTQSGTLTLSEDITIDVELEEKQKELSWACYKNGTHWYVKLPLSTSSVFGQGDGDNGEAYSSSEIMIFNGSSYSIVSVDEETLVVGFSLLGKEFSFTRYKAGDIYE